DTCEGTSVKVIFSPPFDSEFSEERIRHVLKSDNEEWEGCLEYLVGVDRICWSEPVPPFVEPSWCSRRYDSLGWKKVLLYDDMIVFPPLMTFQRLLLNRIEEDIQLMLSKVLELKSFLGDV
ncbi:hypothetical protein IGI04_036172, partial [Brassica rapa subsp. trilocularis]